MRLRYLVDTNTLSEPTKLDLILVTRNVRHFQAFEGLRLEDWAAS